jgi:hypothetical protein
MPRKPLFQDLTGPEGPHFAPTDQAAQLEAWTEIDTGRFMPRRVRGSYLGRVLG